jgi:hypothetical protein
VALPVEATGEVTSSVPLVLPDDTTWAGAFGPEAELAVLGQIGGAGGTADGRGAGMLALVRAPGLGQTVSSDAFAGTWRVFQLRPGDLGALRVDAGVMAFNQQGCPDPAGLSLLAGAGEAGGPGAITVANATCPTIASDGEFTFKMDQGAGEGAAPGVTWTGWLGPSGRVAVGRVLPASEAPQGLVLMVRTWATGGAPAHLQGALQVVQVRHQPVAAEPFKSSETVLGLLDHQSTGTVPSGFLSLYKIGEVPVSPPPLGPSPFTVAPDGTFTAEWKSSSGTVTDLWQGAAIPPGDLFGASPGVVAVGVEPDGEGGFVGRRALLFMLFLRP